MPLPSGLGSSSCAPHQTVAARHPHADLGVGVGPDETIVTKHRYDAFYGTNLEVVLRSNKVQNLILTGVATNVCVESTMRSAYFRDFEVAVVEDCCAARNVSAHEATLENVRKHFGLVAAADDIEQIWRDAAAKPRLTAVGG